MRQKVFVLLQTLFFRNWLHIHQLAPSDIFGVLYKILASSPMCGFTCCLAQLCLRSALDLGYKERRATNDTNLG